jgi:hypothetical protein
MEYEIRMHVRGIQILLLPTKADMTRKAAQPPFVPPHHLSFFFFLFFFNSSSFTREARKHEKQLLGVSPLSVPRT